MKLSSATALLGALSSISVGVQAQPFFNRVSTFLVCTQLDPTCNVDDQTSAEIVAASPDGLTIIYTDSNREEVGLVDITDPTSPVGIGTITMPGEPTSAKYLDAATAVVGVNTSPDFVNASGVLGMLLILFVVFAIGCIF